MMRILALNVVFAVSVVALVGCAGAPSREESVDTVVRHQIDVLKKLRAIRAQDAVQSKIHADPVLSAQETVLVNGLDSVISSQEAVLEANMPREMERGKHAR